MTQLCNSATDSSWLDDQLSDMISRREKSPPILVIWVYALKLSFRGALEDLLPVDLRYPDRSLDYHFPEDCLLTLELQALISNPKKKTSQKLDALRERDLVTAIIEYIFCRCNIGR